MSRTRAAASLEGTVFFGPFIGEFGWELLFWHGWVRKMCRGHFRGYRRIAASVPGRHPFYPDVDEFWPLPDWYLELGTSPQAYITSGWRGGMPGTSRMAYSLAGVVKDVARLRRPRPGYVEVPLSGADVETHADALLREFQDRLPAGTQCFVPWKLNEFEPDSLVFGTDLPDGVLPTKYARPMRRIPFQHQLFEVLQPTPNGEAALNEIVGSTDGLVAIFPRRRMVRRADKNWSAEKYLSLIQRIQGAWPDVTVAIFGEPGGCHFADGVPPGCLDLINVPRDLRMDLQIAALQRSLLAIGSISGATLVALAAGCPALSWGEPELEVRFYSENVNGTPVTYHAVPDPSVDAVFALAGSLRNVARRWREGYGRAVEAAR